MTSNLYALLLSAAVAIGGAPAAAAQTVEDDCGVMPVEDSDRVPPEALTFARTAIDAELMVPMLVSKTDIALQRDLDSTVGFADAERQRPGLRTAVTSAVLDVARHCFPVLIGSLQIETGRIMSLYATAAQLSTINSFAVSSAGRRLRNRGYEIALADDGALAAMTPAQREQHFLRQTRQTFDAMTPAEIAVLSRFSGNAAGRAFVAAQPELNRAMATWVAQTNAALRPRYEMAIAQNIAELPMGEAQPATAEPVPGSGQ